VANNEDQYLDVEETVLNSLFFADSVITSMEEFDGKLFLGLENGELLSFNGLTVTSENNDFINIKSIRKVKTDNKILYIFFDNTKEFMIMRKLSDGTYSFSIIDSEG